MRAPRPAVVGGLTILGVVAGIALTGVLAAMSPAQPTMTTGIVENPDFGPVGTTEQVPCPDALKEGAAFAAAGSEVEGQTFSCGVVVVQENHDTPGGRTIELFYLKLHATGASPEAEPMVYLAGGPGSSGSTELTGNPTMYLNMQPIRERRDIIAYDQRGTGYSNYLLCSPFESTLGILQDRERNPEIGAAIKDLQDSELGTGYGALRANLCGLGTRLLGGVDLAQYNSVASARDIPVLVQALGYPGGYSLYGTSYGSRLAQVAMRTVPDGIRGVVLDGPTGPAIPNIMWSSQKFVSPYVAVFEQCAEDPACSAAYPDIETRFGALLDRLAKQPIKVDPPIVMNPALASVFQPVLTEVDPGFFLSVANLDNLAFGGGLAASVPRLVDALERGDVSLLRQAPLAAAAGTEAPTTSVPADKDPTPALGSEQPLFEVPFQTLLGLAQAAKSAQAQAGLEGQWLSVVLGDLSSRLQAGENQADLMEALLRLAVVPNTGSSAKQLTDYADAWLSPSAATSANAITAAMTRTDVRQTMWTIQDVAMTLTTQPETRGYSDGMKLAVNCNDEIAFTTLDVAKASRAASPYPQLAAYPPSVDEQNLLSCRAYPSPLDRSVTDPVTSDIPALLFASQLDTETPVTWAREVAKTLSRSTVVEWRNLGHVAAAHDPKLCAGSIAAAFLDDPSKVPDTSCSQTDEYRLQFALP